MTGRTRHPLATSLAVALSVLVGGCSPGLGGPAPSQSPPTSATTGAPTESVAPTSQAPSPTSPASTTATATGSPTPAPSGNPTATPVATTLPTASTPPAPPLEGPLPAQFIALDKVIRDDALGHEIATLRMARGLPWPTGSAGQSAAFELLAVEMRWTPGATYTAALREIDVALITGSQYPNRPDPLIDAQLTAAGWALLPPEVPAGQSVTGWVVFKVDPKAATSIRLDYTRPEIVVAGSRKSFPKKVFSVQIVG